MTAAVATHPELEHRRGAQPCLCGCVQQLGCTAVPSACDSRQPMGTRRMRHVWAAEGACAHDHTVRVGVRLAAPQLCAAQVSRPAPLVSGRPRSKSHQDKCAYQLLRASPHTPAGKPTSFGFGCDPLALDCECPPLLRPSPLPVLSPLTIPLPSSLLLLLLLPPSLLPPLLLPAADPASHAKYTRCSASGLPAQS